MAVVGRWSAVRTRGPTVVWSAAIVAIPAFALFTASRLDGQVGNIGHR